MEKVKRTRVAHYVDRFAVESQPGLTNAQLMLTNHDLKPVEPARRQWGPWNFVGFWIADSFNIVRTLLLSPPRRDDRCTLLTRRRRRTPG
jgi:cytosine/uracil/thiamine/allantoin permease